MPTEAQKRATKKWVEAHKETNSKRISECIQRRYQTDEEFRNKKRDTERERQRLKREQQKKAEEEAHQQEQQNVIIVVNQDPVHKQQYIQPAIIYGF
jgi:hypothetical protein